MEHVEKTVFRSLISIHCLRPSHKSNCPAGPKAQLWSTVLPHASDRLKLDHGGKGTLRDSCLFQGLPYSLDQYLSEGGSERV